MCGSISRGLQAPEQHLAFTIEDFSFDQLPHHGQQIASRSQIEDSSCLKKKRFNGLKSFHYRSFGKAFGQLNADRINRHFGGGRRLLYCGNLSLIAKLVQSLIKLDLCSWQGSILNPTYQLGQIISQQINKGPYDDRPSKGAHHACDE